MKLFCALLFTCATAFARDEITFEEAFDYCATVATVDQFSDAALALDAANLSIKSYSTLKCAPMRTAIEPSYQACLNEWQQLLMSSCINWQMHVK